MFAKLEYIFSKKLPAAADITKIKDTDQSIDKTTINPGLRASSGISFFQGNSSIPRNVTGFNFIFSPRDRRDSCDSQTNLTDSRGGAQSLTPHNERLFRKSSLNQKQPEAVQNSVVRLSDATGPQRHRCARSVLLYMVYQTGKITLTHRKLRQMKLIGTIKPLPNKNPEMSFHICQRKTRINRTRKLHAIFSRNSHLAHPTCPPAPFGHTEYETTRYQKFMTLASFNIVI
ncbi:uncharacterized protein LOC129750584 [Uranotaenia lowii]|uniref:uncharacterized protein LOC129750584 n=1 Tax=Uranotaenia lowii TaxID=190385 RepID=UPI002478BBF3|nr:uncharacterized protein LOC129750584 [Uranotaenia lowii]